VGAPVPETPVADDEHDDDDDDEANDDEDGASGAKVPAGLRIAHLPSGSLEDDVGGRAPGAKSSSSDSSEDDPSMAPALLVVAAAPAPPFFALRGEVVVETAARAAPKLSAAD
jgi:hypothetical protein